jgi:hypothetical protein
MKRWQLTASTMNLQTLDVCELDLPELQQNLLPCPQPVFSSIEDAWKYAHEISLANDFEWGVREIYPNRTVFGLHFFPPTEEEVKALPLNLQFLWHANVDVRIHLKIAAHGHIIYVSDRDKLTEYTPLLDGTWNITEWEVASSKTLDLNGVHNPVSTQSESKK